MKKSNWFTKFIALAFIVFLGLYIASESGYYEAKVKKNVALTDEAIAQFESDIKEGKIVDINTYVQEERRDYSNSFTKAGDKITKVTEELLTGGIKNIWEFFKILF